MRSVAEQALDDPRAALSGVRQRLASLSAGDAGTAFWLRLALVDVLVHTDQEAESRRELAAAAQALPAGAAGPQERLWLEHFQRYVDTGAVDQEASRRQQAAGSQVVLQHHIGLEQRVHGRQLQALDALQGGHLAGCR